jgi:hypothetical protein
MVQSRYIVGRVHQSKGHFPLIPLSRKPLVTGSFCTSCSLVREQKVRQSRQCLKAHNSLSGMTLFCDWSLTPKGGSAMSVEIIEIVMVLFDNTPYDGTT